MMNKKLLLAAAAVATLGTSAAYAGETETVSVFDSYTCSKLTALEYENVPTAIYYIEGYTDNAGNEEVDITEEFDAIPVEKVYIYCVQNPEELVVDVISANDDE